MVPSARAARTPWLVGAASSQRSAESVAVPMSWLLYGSSIPSPALSARLRSTGEHLPVVNRPYWLNLRRTSGRWIRPYGLGSATRSPASRAATRTGPSGCATYSPVVAPGSGSEFRTVGSSSIAAEMICRPARSEATKARPFSTCTSNANPGSGCVPTISGRSGSSRLMMCIPSPPSARKAWSREMAMLLAWPGVSKC